MHVVYDDDVLLPARAGVIPPLQRGLICSAPAPRARGGDPVIPANTSPPGLLLPARAGVIPYKYNGKTYEITAPRARGGDPMLIYL